MKFRSAVRTSAKRCITSTSSRASRGHPRGISLPAKLPERRCLAAASFFPLNVKQQPKGSQAFLRVGAASNVGDERFHIAFVRLENLRVGFLLK